jgi:RNA polymerase sigma-70 factor (ECF subfamily)
MELLPALLAELNNGSDDAAEKIFIQYEPYLRMVVRRQLNTSLRPKFDSADVVQSVWADLMDGFKKNGWKFKSSSDLRAFLVRATMNRFIDHVRRHRSAVHHETKTDDKVLQSIPDADWPTPSEEAQVQDVWNKMLSLCPPKHRKVLLLRRQGMRSDEIAKHTGLHGASVRRILCDLATRMARSDETGGASFLSLSPR